MKLLLKQAMGGTGGEYMPDTPYETADIDEAQRLVVRGIAIVHPDEKQKLPPLSADERATILSGKVIVTKVRGKKVPESDVGERNWAGMYRNLQKSDATPRVRDKITKMFSQRPRGHQSKAYGPGKAAPAE